MNPVETVMQHIKLPFDGSLHDYQVTDVISACYADNFGFYL